jgi:hypothetical protein
MARFRSSQTSQSKQEGKEVGGNESFAIFENARLMREPDEEP